MNKSNIKSEFGTLLSNLMSEGLTLIAWGSDNTVKSPLIEYKLLNSRPIIIQDRIERWTEWSFIVRTYADNSVSCAEISDKIGAILKPVGFIEQLILDEFDKNSMKYTMTSIYRITLDENGISYGIK